MADTDLAALRFLPWVRQGAAAEIADGGVLQVNFKVNAADVTMPMRLLGPGAVTGIDPKQIIRMEPRPGTVDFTPYNFPAVEFDRPDFPWLFTPLKGDGNDRIRPWICLVVVRKQLGVGVRFSQGAVLPVLEIKRPAQPRQELPDLDESWAWAHAQVAGRSGASSPEDGLADAALNLSRLMCPRKLEPDTDYVACVVPAFDTGRKAGLGLPVDGPEDLTPAWSFREPAPTELLLPVYHHWEFRAGPPVDFESLVRLLKARPLPERAGKRDLWIGQAGSGLPRIAPDGVGAMLALEGALRPPDSRPGDWPAAPRAAFQTRLGAVLNAPADALDAGATDPVVAPPIYGRWHAARNHVDLSGGQPPWLSELNLDPRHRIAAGLGAEVVRRDQEALMAAAWEQVGEIEQANQLLRRAQLARSVTSSLLVRHFREMPESTLLQVTTPAHAKLRAVTLPDGALPPPSLTLYGQIARSTTRASLAPIRKMLRPRGPVFRRAPATRPGVIAAALAPPPRAMVTIEALSDALFAARPDVRARVRSHGVTPEALNPVAPRAGFVWVFTLQPEGGELLFGHWERGRAGAPPAGYNPAYLNFQAAAIAHEAGLPRPGGVAFLVRAELGRMTTPILAQLDPATTITARVHARIARTAGRVERGVASVTSDAEDPLAPIMAAPDFPRPMYEGLRDLSSDYLLPGLEHVPPNTATALETNPVFIEAFMAGLSTEMARELLWREFPTDQRGTYFRQFWAAASPADRRQIQAMHEWKNPLGDNAEPGQPRASVVLLVRGELLRRYPGTVIYARQGVKSGSRRVPGLVEKYPLFRGSLEPDVTFLGFDLAADEVRGSDADPGWFFVLQEQPSAPRFGLDKAAGFAGAIPRAAKWSDLTWGHLASSQAAFDALTHVPASAALPDTSAISQPPGIAWGKNSAHLAYATYQQPVRIAIHGSDLVPPRDPEVVR
jgi:hypothetical protein